MNFNINTQYGFWENGGHDNHLFDQNLATALLQFFNENQIKTVVDFGCGTGDYTNYFLANNILCEGYDGNPNTPEVSNGTCGVLNLASEVNLQKRFDCVLSLEVGEHIPKEYESTFISNLERHSSGLILISWAIPGQGGGGHFNEQSNEYITSVFKEIGYNRELIDYETSLRNQASFSWFKHTLMIFSK